VLIIERAVNDIAAPKLSQPASCAGLANLRPDWHLLMKLREETKCLPTGGQILRPKAHRNAINCRPANLPMAGNFGLPGTTLARLR